MTLTKAGRYLAMQTVGGGVRPAQMTSSLNDQTITSTSGTKYATRYVSSGSSKIMGSSSSSYPSGVYFGSGLLSDENGVYSFSDAYTRTLTNTANSSELAVITNTDVDNGKTYISVSLSNTRDAAKTYTHYGFVGSVNCVNFTSSGPSTTQAYCLFSYYELAEPLVIQPGETKAVQIVVDVSNL